MYLRLMLSRRRPIGGVRGHLKYSRALRNRGAGVEDSRNHGEMPVGGPLILLRKLYIVTGSDGLVAAMALTPD